MDIKKIRAFLAIIGLSTIAISIDGCSEEKEPSANFKEVIDDYSKDTCLDELILRKENIELFKNIIKLDKYLSLSEKLHDLDLEDETTELESNGNLETLSVSQIKEAIKSLDKLAEKKDIISKDSNQYYLTLLTLKYNEELINKWIYYNGYDVAANFGLLEVKSKIVDACKLDSSEYSSFKVLPAKKPEDDLDIIYVNDETKKTYKINLEEFNLFEGESSMSKMISCIYDCQHSEKNKEPETEKLDYNSSRNEMLSKSLDTFKRGIYAKYKMKEENLEQTNDNTEIDKAYEKLLKKK